jgi:putative heme-binding domain-containing protein
MSDPTLQIEAIGRLGDSAHPEAPAILIGIAHDRIQPPFVRVEALVSLAGKPALSLVSLLNDPEPGVQLEAARSLRLLGTNPAVLDAVKMKLQSTQEDEGESRLRSQLEFLSNPESVSRPNNVQDWQDLLRNGGDPDAGRRVFFSANSICITCHAVYGRGVKLGSGSTAGFIAMPYGPDLSVIGRTADRAALIHSIVKPSDSVASEYQGWFVQLKNGTMEYGREIDQGNNAIQLVMLDGHEHDFPREDIQTWGAMEHSLMPEGLPQSMAIEEFRDLIAFLESLK